MNEIDNRIAELEKELSELKRQKYSSKEYIFNEDTDIIMYEYGKGEKYFDNFKKLFEAIKKKMKCEHKFSIWYKSLDSTDEFNKEWDIDNFNENEILEIFSKLNAYELLIGEFCISNKKDEIYCQIYFKTPFLKKYDEIVFQRTTLDEKEYDENEYLKLANEGKEWRLFKNED